MIWLRVIGGILILVVFVVVGVIVFSDRVDTDPSLRPCSWRKGCR